MTETRIATNLRLLLLLEAIGEADSSMTPTELARVLGLPKQTVHRLCTTLIEEGFVVRESPGKRLRPARRMREMAAGILQASHQHIARHQVLQDVAKAVQETVNFVMPEDTGMSYKDRVETDWAFRVQLPVGSNVPFHCTASGKCYLASLRKSEREKLVNAMALESWTANTITDPKALLTVLRQIAKQGFAIDNEEFMDGMLAIAVPVRDHRGRYLASLAFHGPAMRLSVESVIAKKDVLIDGAERISKILLSEAVDSESI